MDTQPATQSFHSLRTQVSFYPEVRGIFILKVLRSHMFEPSDPSMSRTVVEPRTERDSFDG